MSEPYLFLLQCRPRWNLHLHNRGERQSMRSAYSILSPKFVLTHDQSPNTAMDQTNPPAYVPISVTRSVPTTELPWSKRPNYVGPYVSFPPFPETLPPHRILRVRKYARPTSISPRRKRTVLKQSSSLPNRKSPFALTRPFVPRVYIRLSCVSNLSHHIPSRDHRSS